MATRLDLSHVRLFHRRDFVHETLFEDRMSCFFFQAEDGIRDLTVTGVQTCALPIWPLDDLLVGTRDGAEDPDHLVDVPHALPGVRLGQVREHEVVESGEIARDRAARLVVERAEQLGDDRLGAVQVLAEAGQVARDERLARALEKGEAAIEDQQQEARPVDGRHLRFGVLVCIVDVHTSSPYRPNACCRKLPWFFRPLTKVSSAVNCWRRFTSNASTSRCPASIWSWSDRI